MRLVIIRPHNFTMYAAVDERLPQEQNTKIWFIMQLK